MRESQIDLTLCRLRIELPLPVYFHAVTVSGEGKMVMFGGVDSIEQNTRTNKGSIMSFGGEDGDVWRDRIRIELSRTLGR